MDKKILIALFVFIACIPMIAQNTLYSVAGSFKRSADEIVVDLSQRIIPMDYEIIDLFYPDSLTFDNSSLILFPNQVKFYLESFREHNGGNNGLDRIISELNHAQRQIDSLLDRKPYLKSKEYPKKVIKELRLVLQLTPLDPSIIPNNYMEYIWWTYDGGITVGDIFLVVDVSEESNSVCTTIWDCSNKCNSNQRPQGQTRPNYLMPATSYQAVTTTPTTPTAI